MNIVVCCKVVPDDQDIQVAADGTLDYSKAKPIVSAYDLNAIEAAAQLAAANEAAGGTTLLATGDRDSLQLVDDATTCCLPPTAKRCPWTPPPSRKNTAWPRRS